MGCAAAYLTKCLITEYKRVHFSSTVPQILKINAEVCVLLLGFETWVFKLFFFTDKVLYP